MMNHNIFLVAAGAVQLAHDEIIKGDAYIPDLGPGTGRMADLLWPDQLVSDAMILDFVARRLREIAGVPPRPEAEITE